MSGFRCPCCQAELQAVAVVDASPSKAAPPVLRSSPALPAVPEDRETIQEREARLKVLRGWYEAAPPGVRGRIDDMVTMRLSDWREAKVRSGKRIEPADEMRRKRALFDEALEEHARPDVGWLHAPRPRPNTTHEVLPRGDRDEDEESR